MGVKVLVIGGGGREHALVWKLNQSPASIVFSARREMPARHLRERAIPATDLAALALLRKENQIDLTVVGPDDPLAAGIVDLFSR